MTEALGANGGLSVEEVSQLIGKAEQGDKNALPAFLTWALPEGPCDIPPCSLLHCHVHSDCLVMHQEEMSAPGRNRHFFRVLRSHDTTCESCSCHSARAEEKKGSTLPHMGSCHTVPPVGPSGGVAEGAYHAQGGGG